MTMLSDKEALKVVLLELLQEDKEFCRAVAKEINGKNGEQSNRRKEIIKSIDEDFKKYENVFKKLA